MQATDSPLNQKLILRIAVLLVVVFSILTGYYQNQFHIWKEDHLVVLHRLGVKTTEEALKKSLEDVK